MDAAAGVVDAAVVATSTSKGGIVSGAKADVSAGGQPACPLSKLPPAILEDIFAALRGLDMFGDEHSNAGPVRQACRWLKAAYDNSNTHLSLGDNPFPSGLESQQMQTKAWQRLSALVLATPHLTSLRLPYDSPWLPWSTLMDICRPALPRLTRLTLWDGSPFCYDSDDLFDGGPEADDDDDGAHGDNHVVPFPSLRPLAAAAPSLTHLDLRRCRHVVGLSSLSTLASLRHLNMEFTSVRDLAPLSALSQLVYLNITGCAKLTDHTPLTALTSLTHLVMGACDHMELGAPPSVVTLHADSSKWENISALSACSSLTHLDLRSCHSITDISALSGCSSLTHLNLQLCYGVTSINALSRCPSVTYLDLSLCARITDIRALSRCPSLTYLDLSHCTRITDVTALSNCSSLTYLDLRNCIHPIDTSALPRRSSLVIHDDNNSESSNSLVQPLLGS